MGDPRILAISEAQVQGVDPRIVLATVDAETSFSNIIGDSGNALGFGQVWPLYHNDAFQYAANRFRVAWPSDLSSQTQVVLSNDALSMAAAVYVIKQDWIAANGDFTTFTGLYVGSAEINNPANAADFQRRFQIWLKYQNMDPSNLSQVVGNSTSSSGFQGVDIPTTQYGVVPYSQTLGNVLYGRRYRVLVSTLSGTVMDVSQLRCTFSINKTVLSQPNFSQVTIYNLAPGTENTLIQGGQKLYVEAGYEGQQYANIFTGDIIQPIRDKEDGVTYRLSLYSLDGDQFLNQSIVNFSMAKTSSLLTQRQIVNNLASQATIPTQVGDIASGLDATTLSRGKSFFGMTRDYMRQIAQTNNITFYVEDGLIHIVDANGSATDNAIDISPTSGLIGTPVQNDQGISFKCLLNPYIKPRSLVYIDNSLIQAQRIQLGQFQRQLDQSGLYRVISVTHVGDTRGQDWYSEAICVSQAGPIASLTRDSLSNPF